MRRRTVTGTIVLRLAVVAALIASACTSTKAGTSTPMSQATQPSTSSGPATVSPSQGSESLVQPAARGYAMMADLPGQRGVVLLGGADAPGPPDLPDMWTYSPKANWQESTPAALPELSEYGDGVIGNAFEFDLGSGRAVFVDIEGNTWTYDPATDAWEAKNTKGGPTELLGASMVYDAGSDRMIVFGGFMFDSGVNAETWAYDLNSNTWERMHPRRHPSARNYSAMAYDEGSDRVILFGGGNDFDNFGDTWAYEYEGDSWTKMSPARSPEARAYSWMVYDPRSDRVVLFGGSEDDETAAFEDTWTYDYDKDAWSRLDVHGPSPRGWHAMAFDRETGKVVLFGGGSTRDEYTAETWIYDPAANAWSLVSR